MAECTRVPNIYHVYFKLCTTNNLPQYLDRLNARYSRRRQLTIILPMMKLYNNRRDSWRCYVTARFLKKFNTKFENLLL